MVASLAVPAAHDVLGEGYHAWRAEARWPSSLGRGVMVDVVMQSPRAPAEQDPLAEPAGPLLPSSLSGLPVIQSEGGPSLAVISYKADRSVDRARQFAAAWAWLQRVDPARAADPQAIEWLLSAGVVAPARPGGRAAGTGLP